MTTSAHLPTDKTPVLQLVAMPADANFQGDIFGGWILSQIDLAGSVPASRRAKGRVVTVAVQSTEFHEPIFVGDLISCYAEITKVGTTSITVQVEVWATRNPADEEVIKVTEAVMTYVAIDDDRRPRPVSR